MTDIAEGLIRRVLAEPGDTLARLVFADWLDESGDAAWAEYIRLRAQGAPDSAEAGRRVTATLALPAAEFAANIAARLDLLPAANFTVTVEDYAVPRPILGRMTESAAVLWRGLPLAAEPGRTLVGMVAPTDRRAVVALGELVDGEAVAVRVPGDQLADLVARTFTRAIALVGARPAVTVTRG